MWGRRGGSISEHEQKNETVLLAELERERQRRRDERVAERTLFGVKLERVRLYLISERDAWSGDDPFDPTNLRQWVREGAPMLAMAHACLMVLGQHQPYIGDWDRGCSVCHVHARMSSTVGVGLADSGLYPCTTVRNVVGPFFAVLETLGIDR